MIIITGGLGFIGSNIIHALNDRGYTDILIVDDFTDGSKFANVADARVADFIDKEEFLTRIRQGQVFSDDVQAICHQGACSATTEWNGKLVLENNFTYAKHLLHYARQHSIPFVYASSASVYGNGTACVEAPQFERPLNVYAYSKTLLDQYCRKVMAAGQHQVVGLRYFNVYGPREQHKGSMASVALHLRNQLQDKGEGYLFAGSDGYGPGEQRRDFIHVADVVEVILWFLEHPEISGIFNVGTGRSQSFNEVAQAVLKAMGVGKISYIPFPEHLQRHYQSFTQANISSLRAAGYTGSFRNVESGIAEYMHWLGHN